EPMRCNRREMLAMGSSSLALAGITQLLNAVVPRAATAAPISALSPYDAMGLAELTRTKEITPLEAIDDTIPKIEAVNPKLTAVIYKTYDYARQRATQPVSGAPFAGVPLLVKDNATIAGIPSTRGSRALRGSVPDRTAPFFAAVEAAGFNVVGVT